ncbi:hypothetical protein FS837_008203 [Tulasnella sp. UAMH 9824]|nr:hypothetical protein FS837_008203 [Tulasnella sp. UAMH 9824]
MSSPEEQAALQAFLKEAAYFIKAVQIIFCAFYAVAVWDWLVSLKREYRLIWQSKWSVIKVLYLLSRYWVLFIFPYVLWCYVENHSLDTCQKIYKSPVALAMWNQLWAEGVLLVRTFAFLGNKLSILIPLLFCLSCVVAYQVFVDNTQMTLLPFLDPAGGPCLPTVKYAGSPHIMLFFVFPLIYDTLVTGLTLWRAWHLRLQSGGTGSPLLKTFVSEGDYYLVFKRPQTHEIDIGLWYFVLISAANLCNAVFYWQPKQVMSALLIPFSVVLPNILVCRMILGLRERGLRHSTTAHTSGLGSRTARTAKAGNTVQPGKSAGATAVGPDGGVVTKMEFNHELTTFNRTRVGESESVMMGDIKTIPYELEEGPVDSSRAQHGIRVDIESHRADDNSSDAVVELTTRAAPSFRGLRIFYDDQELGGMIDGIQFDDMLELEILELSGILTVQGPVWWGGTVLRVVKLVNVDWVDQISTFLDFLEANDQLEIFHYTLMEPENIFDHDDLAPQDLHSYDTIVLPDLVDFGSLKSNIYSSDALGPQILPTPYDTIVLPNLTHLTLYSIPAFHLLTILQRISIPAHSYINATLADSFPPEEPVDFVVPAMTLLAALRPSSSLELLFDGEEAYVTATEQLWNLGFYNNALDIEPREEAYRIFLQQIPPGIRVLISSVRIVRTYSEDVGLLVKALSERTIHFTKFECLVNETMLAALWMDKSQGWEGFRLQRLQSITFRIWKYSTARDILTLSDILQAYSATVQSNMQGLDAKIVVPIDYDQGDIQIALEEPILLSLGPLIERVATDDVPTDDEAEFHGMFEVVEEDVHSDDEESEEGTELDDEEYAGADDLEEDETMLSHSDGLL